jgi:hypothetical protein
MFAGPNEILTLPEPTWQTPNGRVQLYRADCGDLLPRIQAVGPTISLMLADPPNALDAQHDDTLGRHLASYAQAVGWTTVMFAPPGHPWPLPGQWLVWATGRVRGCTGLWHQTWELIQVHSPLGKEGPHDSAILDDGEFGETHVPPQKPVALLAYLIGYLAASGGVVLDPCMGQGWSALAALKRHRRFIGIEKDPEIYAQAEQRIREDCAQSVFWGAP